MVFHWSLSDSKSPQITRTLFNILSDLNNAIVWMTSTRSLISESSCPFTNPLVTVPRAPIIIRIIIIIIIIYSFRVFTSVLADGFHWSLSDSKSPQVSKNLLGILAILSNTVMWIVSTRPPTSKSSRPFNNPLVIVPKVPITIGTFVTFMFHSFFNSLARSKYLSFFSHSFSFILWSAGTAKSTILQVFFFFFCC